MPEPGEHSRRADAMIRRVAAAARGNGIDDEGVDTLWLAFRVALDAREARIPDPRHPDLLHPGRTTLILLDDAGVTEPDVLAAGMVTDTFRRELSPSAAAIEEALGGRVRRLTAAIPDPAALGDDLFEALVTADRCVRLVALTERLDHARHLHLRARGTWVGFHQLSRLGYLPVAERTHPMLARRYRWWCDMFARRYLARRAP